MSGAEAHELRFVRFEDPQAFLEATKSYDDSFLNFSLGSLYDYLGSPQYAADPSQPVYLLAVYRGDELLLTVTHNKTDFAFMLSVPSSAQHTLIGTPHTPGLLAPATALLASSTLDLLSANPLVLDKMIGFGPAVQSFLTTWTALLAARGLRVHIDAGTKAASSSSRVSYVTRLALPPPLTPPFAHPITQASTPDLDDLAQLYIAFQHGAPWHGVFTRSAALAVVAPAVSAGLVWLVRVGGAAVGYVLLGRATPRTIALRNVYVQPSHRRQGIAEAMVRGVTRYFLDAPPYGVQPAHRQDGPPAVCFKEEVNLNVGDDVAERVYRRAGFLFPDRTGEVVTGGVDPATGRQGWYESYWRGIALSEPEAVERSSEAPIY